MAENSEAVESSQYLSLLKTKRSACGQASLLIFGLILPCE